MTVPTSSPAARHLHPRWQLLWHRSLQRLGWPGLLGLLLLVVALLVGVLAWQSKLKLTALEQTSRVQGHTLARASSASALKTTPPEEPLPTRSDIHTLIAQIQRSAAEQQLVWLAADYRYKAATSESLARLEVHGSLRGAYKPLRLWLVQLKEDAPSLLLQEANINRPNADVAEVDAKLVLVFALADGFSPGNSASLGLGGAAQAQAPAPATPPSREAPR
jgi:hypothetical protein